MTKNTDEAKKRFLSLSNNAFPRPCPCGKERYDSAEDYLLKTLDINSSHGIKAVNDEGERFLDVFRNCTYGATLLEFFQERRVCDDKRILFQQKMDSLIESGVSREYARIQILSQQSNNNE